MNMSKTYSVVIPTYNKVHEIRRCLSSIIHNELVPDEIIIVDNNSTDGSLELITDLYNQGVFKPVKNFRIVKEKMQGAGNARNRGLREASSEYIILLDADDYWEKNLLVRLDNLISKYESSLYVLGYRHSYGSPNRLRNRNIKRGVSVIKKRETFFFHYFWNRGFICSSNIVISRSAVERVEFPPNSYEEDLQLWFKLAGTETFTFDPQSYVIIDKKPLSDNSSSLQKKSSSKIAQNIICGFWEQQCRYRRSIYLGSYSQVLSLIVSRPKYFITVILEISRRVVLIWK